MPTSKESRHMYIRHLEIENTGPISELKLDFLFDDQKRPLPIILVGKNGSGKSIALAHLVNAMISARSAVYDDGDLEKGKVFKLRTPSYISHAASYSRATVKFEGDFVQSEMELKTLKRDYEETFHHAPIDPIYREIKATEHSIYTSNFHRKLQETETAVQHFTQLYFPPNRFEEPAWLNAHNLRGRVSYAQKPILKGSSGRRIIAQSTLEDNQNWLLDIIYDAFVIERQIVPLNTPNGVVQCFAGHSGGATNIRLAIEKFIATLLQIEGTFGWVVGLRGNRNLALNDASGHPIIQNLFALSTGQIALLNIFLTIMRDFDLSRAGIRDISDIRGTVLIDEVDLHLHADLQHTVLPQLIALFPKVQFVLSTHSPLFILGLEKTLGTTGVQVVELPFGRSVGSERFTEFLEAYRYFSTTAAHESALEEAIQNSQRPILFVEGTTDIDYLQAAAALLGRGASLEKFRILDANGFGGLDKLWKHFDGPVAKLLHRKVTLLYDCDVPKQNSEKSGVRRLVIPAQQRRLSKGIENLLTEDMVERAIKAKSAFIDITPSLTKLVRGIEVEAPELWEVNIDEKRNMTNWVVEHATSDDLADFAIVFDLLDANPAKPLGD